ncbi:MAG: arylmalonate decarboxylase [Pseudomonadota bacterium]
MQDMFDLGHNYRAKLGFVLLATEQTIEENMYRMCPPNVGLHFTRAPIPDSITVDTLASMAGDLAAAATLLLPDGSLDVISYACTSGSLVIGEERVFKELRKGAPAAEPTSLITSVIRALRQVTATRIAVATPYLDAINSREAAYLEQAGLTVTSIQGLNLEKDSDMIRVRPDFLADFVTRSDTPDSDTVFISCGALRSIDIVEQLEQHLGKPVICSNQAMLWDMLRLAGIPDRVRGYGALLAEH